ncbi:hypothetical protein RRG08_031274 [Elysia crispata]|uniref:Uncharacterized protein n=1 Tax=Elysia crispata TaxID=231223 RepID=A0AAE1AJ58_9GAST|nr:hypothetical protein RRG08_031274 [Elysia crispata]
MLAHATSAKSPQGLMYVALCGLGPQTWKCSMQLCLLACSRGLAAGPVVRSPMHDVRLATASLGRTGCHTTPRAPPLSPFFSPTSPLLIFSLLEMCVRAFNYFTWSYKA